MKRYLPAALAFLLGATPALAHPGHLEAGGLVQGLLHPVTGLDHLLVMLLVGLWSGLALPAARWVCPAAFVAFMLLGFAVGAPTASLPLVEATILASLVALGLALLTEARAPVAAAAAVIAVFAAAHGMAHRAEAPGGGGFVIGFTLATLVLHLIGLRLAGIARQGGPGLSRLAGGGALLVAIVTPWSA